MTPISANAIREGIASMEPLTPTDALADLNRLKVEYDAAARMASETGEGVLLWVQSAERFGRAMMEHADYLLAAADEAEANREDAARYQWLRGSHPEEGSGPWVTTGYEIHQPTGTEIISHLAGAALDAAIDAARGATDVVASAFRWAENSRRDAGRD